MDAILTNQSTDIWHFNKNISKANYFLIFSYGNVVGFEWFCERNFAKSFTWSQHFQFSFFCLLFALHFWCFYTISFCKSFDSQWQYAKCKAIRPKGNALWTLFGCTTIIIFLYSHRMKWIIYRKELFKKSWKAMKNRQKRRKNKQIFDWENCWKRYVEKKNQSITQLRKKNEFISNGSKEIPLNIWILQFH